MEGAWGGRGRGHLAVLQALRPPWESVFSKGTGSLGSKAEECQDQLLWGTLGTLREEGSGEAEAEPS